jgi:hypothetical protein
MFKPISTLVRTAAGRLPRRLPAAAAVAAIAVGLLGAPPAAVALAAPSAPAAGHVAAPPAKAVPPRAAPVKLAAPPSAVRPAGTAPSSAKIPALPASQKRVCALVRPGYAACQAIARTTGVREHRGLFAAGTAPSGYGPADLRSAYNLPAAGGSGQTVAVVDAYDDPVAASDLAVYRKQYGLPPCTTANGCFRKVAQNGSTHYPATDYGWATEISLDLDMVSATCPGCHILLVEATDDSIQNLGAAVDEAVKLGAKYVSNSYSGPEDPQETSWDSAYYDHPGVAVVAATGDYGYDNLEAGAGNYTGASYPAVSPYVTAVGGTTLTRDSGSARGWDESAWFGSGSACSSYEAKPAWQHDSGCVLRTEADVAAVANPNTGVAVYDSYPIPGAGTTLPGWHVVGGTSVASPIITSIYALAGTPLPGTTPASYPYADPSALNDITTGSNSNEGCTPAYLCTAGPGYNGPTGLGTPDGVAAFTLPHGDITGTVTSAAGTPLAGAVVQAGAGSAVTDSTGHYDLSVTPGSYQVTALDLSGYASQAATGVQVATGQDVTESFTLSPAANVSLSGTVTDGSGQGWPVYAKVTLAGTTDVAYTSPYTGRYTLKVPQDGSYTVQVSPVSGGYQQAQQTVTVGTGNLTASFALDADTVTCTAAGYGQAASLSEPFSGTTAPPGWTVVTNGAPDDTWQFGQPDGPNQTPGGTGNYAAATYTQNDADETADTELISPPIDLSHDSYPVLQFDYSINSVGFTNGGYADSVDASTDGGQTWTTVWSVSPYSGAGGTEALAMPEFGGQPSVELRFHYLVPGSAGPLYSPSPIDWQINNVTVSGCQPSPGGLVAGRVTDGNTGQGVTGATVTAAGQSVPTMAVPGDPGTGNGLYEFFSGQSGSQQVTASAPGYAAGTQDVSVTAGSLTQASLTLAAGRLSVASGSVTGTAPVGGKTTTTVTVTNTGTLPVTLSASSKPGGYTPPGETAAQAARGAPLQRISGHFNPLLLPGGKDQATARPAASAPQPVTGSWVPISSPKYLGTDMEVAADPVTGRVYAAGGDPELAINQAGQVFSKTAAVLNPVTGRWSALPAMPVSRVGGQAAVIDGKLYITGGEDNSEAAVPSMVVYSPATDKWSTAASPPYSYTEAAAAVLDGKMYLVGGCDVAIGECGATTVQVYDPATDTWTLAAPYPIAVADLACGAISGKLYCAGGESTYAGSTTAAYVYDPASNAWTPIAPLPIDLYGSAHAAANGQLLLSGGVTGNGTVITNQGFAYDPATGAWSALPDAPEANYGSAGACGFYAIGGVTTTYAEQLPGYGDCGGDSWLSASPSATTIAPGKSATVTVTLNAADASVTQPGTYTATLELANDTPYGTRSVPVTLTATPPAAWGQLTGTVDTATCKGTTTPVDGATVQVGGAHGTWQLTTDTSGSYGLSLDASNDPLTLIVSAPGYQSQAAVVTVTAGATTTRNFTLTPTTSCG